MKGVVSDRALSDDPATALLDLYETALPEVYDDVDGLSARAAAAGATVLAEPADQPHGARHGTLVDPFGHRWMVSQQIETFDTATYAERLDGTGFSVDSGDEADVDGARPITSGAVWAGVYYADAPAAIRFLVDVLGFEERLVVPDDGDPGRIVHAELAWPEGGVINPGTYDDANPFVRSLPPGSQALYLVTSDPAAVYRRCEAAGVEVIRPPEEPHYDPGGMTFAVRDPEGNIWSVGSYAGAG